MQRLVRNAARLGVGIAATGLAVLAGCGSGDAVDSGQVGSAANQTAIPTWLPRSGTAVAGDVAGSPEWQTIAEGAPAIQPVLPKRPGQPSITEQSVRDYIAAHLPGEVDVSKPWNVKRVEFMPVERVEERIDHPVSVSRGAMLCLVTLEGSWILPPKFAVAGTPDPDAVMYLIFDAVTGNYIAKTSGIETD